MARTGYHPEDVDILLERVVAALERGEPCDPVIDAARLRTARRGYEVAGVDALLDRLAPGRARSEEPPVQESRGLFGFLRRG